MPDPIGPRQTHTHRRPPTTARTTGTNSAAIDTKPGPPRTVDTVEQTTEKPKHGCYTVTPLSSKTGKPSGPSKTHCPSRGVEVCERVADLPGNSLLQVMHRWIRTATFERGMGPDNGGVPGRGGSDSPYVAQTKVTDHTGEGDQPGSSCQPAEEYMKQWNELGAPLNEKCLDQALELNKSSGRWSAWNNCQTFVDDTLTQCATPKAQPSVDAAPLPSASPGAGDPDAGPR